MLEVKALSQYCVDTFLNESLYLILRDQFFEPQYPSALCIASLRVHSHAIRLDLYGGVSEEVIKTKEVMKPFKNSQSTTNQYMLGTSDMKELLIPYSLGEERLLRITSCLDVGLFRKLFSTYEISRIAAQIQKTLPEGVRAKYITSICGHSILNKFARIKVQISQWTVMYDVVFDGPEIFEATIPFLATVIMKYSMYLQSDEKSVLLGLYAEDLQGDGTPALSFYRSSTETEL